MAGEEGRMAADGEGSTARDAMMSNSLGMKVSFELVVILFLLEKGWWWVLVVLLLLWFMFGSWSSSLL